VKTPLLTESITALIQAKVQSDLNAALQDVDLQYSDGISLEPVDTIRIAQQVESLSLPCLYILDGPAEPQYDTDPNYQICESQFVLVISSEEVGAENMKRKAWRYQRALLRLFNLAEMVTSDSRLKVYCVPTRFGSTTPSVVASRLPSQEQKYRSDAVLELKIKSFEKNEEV